VQRRWWEQYNPADRPNSIPSVNRVSTITQADVGKCHVLNLRWRGADTSPTVAGRCRQSTGLVAEALRAFCACSGHFGRGWCGDNADYSGGGEDNSIAEARLLHKALEDAKHALSPLEQTAADADEKVSALMNQYQSATITGPPQKTVRSGKAKRAPRSFTAIIMTASSRLLNAEHSAGKKKAQSLNAALDRASLLASTRKEELTEELRSHISARADEIWAAKK
jgi:hypothetical protein